MKKIPLTKGKYTIVDEDDYKKLCIRKWYFKPNSKTLDTGYASSRAGYMHRIIVNAPSNMLVDHINGDKLDNRKSNLRLCTMSQNKANSTQYSSNKSGYKGVYWHKHVKKWQSQIRYKGKIYHLGSFDTALEAHMAHKKKHQKLFKKFSKC